MDGVPAVKRFFNLEYRNVKGIPLSWALHPFTSHTTTYVVSAARAKGLKAYWDFVELYNRLPRITAVPRIAY